MEIIKSLGLLCVFICATELVQGQSATKLQFSKPAEFFEESLVLGNGRMGASVFGGIASDKIFLNDITLWAGQPVNPNMNPEAYKNLPAIRQALKNENYRLADSLNRKLQGKFSESYAPLGTLFIDVKYKGEAKNYSRELDLSTAIAKVSYEVDGVIFTREYFVSYPDQVMVVRLTSSKAGALNFELSFSSLLKFEINTQTDRLKMNGYAPVHAAPSYFGDLPNAVVFDPASGTRFSSLASIKNVGGSTYKSDSSLGVKGATEATVYLSIATSFNGFDKNPATQGIDNKKMAEINLAKSLGKSFREIQRNHVIDYQSYFNRVSLSFGKTDAPVLPTNERLLRYAEGKEDKNLEVLYFNFGRYLLISSSRTKEVPANLQGLWNPHMRPPWSSNYTININAEENYWLAENTNLTELHMPLLSFIGNVAKTGAVTAKTFYGTRGWVAAHNSDIWAMSNPVGDFGKGHPVWANWNMGGVWLSTHLWEHYVFTKDVKWLRADGYPLMKGSAQFCLDWLVADKNGKLITSPSTSPENMYVAPDGYVGATFYGATSDLAMIRELLQQTIQASKILNLDGDFRSEMEKAVSTLYPYQIGKKGNLQEWYFDWEDADPKHRHQSHLFGLHPGHQITPLKTPELASAARKTLEIRGDETTGWSKGWRINLWARLWDGNHAYKMIRELLKPVLPDGTTSYAGGGGTYPNLFDAHPPFQIDGNFGGAAAFAEMLVQSSEDEIRLLPALPDAWPEGEVRGICARGGFEVSMQWANKSLLKLKLFSKKGGYTSLVYGTRTKQVTLKPNETKEVEW